MGLIDDVVGLIKLEKAKVVAAGDNLPDGETEVECMFNPTEYRINTSLTTHGRPTHNAESGAWEFGGSNPKTFSTQLFFDQYADLAGDVTEPVTRLMSWTNPTESSKRADRPAPPLVEFQWGSNPALQGFQGFLKQVNVTYTLFRKNGTPVQAKVDITIEGLPEPWGASQNPTSHGASSRRTHTMIDGDTLASVAFAEYGRAGHWRAIAQFNDIDDPLRVGAGTILLLPKAADAARLS